MRIREKIQYGDGDVRHGTKNGYDNLSCRCTDCCSARRSYVGAFRSNARLNGLPDGDPRHGKRSAYNNHGCRCNLCTKVGNIHPTAMTYGITAERVDEIRQTSNCELCDIHFGDKTPNIDHSHDTGKIRGVLCLRCNVTLGQFEANRIGKTTAKWLEQIGLTTVERYIERGII